MIKNISLFLVILMSTSFIAQNINLDKYQYLIVADKFDYLKKVDQYQTSSLTKFLLKKKGFKVFVSNENIPKELINTRCLSLFVDVKDKSSIITTKSVIEIKDCFGKIVYTSKIGKSKAKDYKKAYQEAIRNAFETMEDFEYSYKANLIADKKENTVAVIPVKTVPKVIVIPTVKKDITIKIAENVLYAQPKTNGFQLVNMKPEVVFLVLKTNVKDVYLIKDKNGIFYKNDNIWVAEYYENDTLVTKEYQVKF